MPPVRKQFIRKLVGPITVIGDDATETRRQFAIAANEVKIVAVIAVPFFPCWLVVSIHIGNAAGLGAENDGFQTSCIQPPFERDVNLLEVTVGSSIAFLSGIPIPLRFVHRQNVIKINALIEVRIAAEMRQNVGEISGELVLGSGFEVGGGNGVGTEVAQPVPRQPLRRAVNGGGKLVQTVRFGRAQKPALVGLTAPVIFSRRRFKAFHRAPVVINGLVIDAGTEIEPPAGQPNAGVGRKQKVGDAVFIRFRPCADFLQRPGIVGPEVVHRLKFPFRIQTIRPTFRFRRATAQAQCNDKHPPPAAENFGGRIHQHCNFPAAAEKLPALNFHRRAGKSVRRRRQFDFSALAGFGADNDQRQAIVGIALRCLEGFKARGVAIVGGDNFARAFNRKTQVILGTRHQQTVLVGNRHRDEG